MLAKDDLVFNLRLTGIRDELKHIEKKCKKNVPELKKTQGAYDTSQKRIKELSKMINNTEDTIFDEFCWKIVVVNIREYEKRQLKVATEESAARLQCIYLMSPSRLVRVMVAPCALLCQATCMQHC
ncbi:hypothetical protein B0H14DRAFT_3539571 [Mycena olivaceomarginata]|nr:hypothetical protein B0H14DRAFT_3539571 [Mycena olivaceomarginata]